MDDRSHVRPPDPDRPEGGRRHRSASPRREAVRARGRCRQHLGRQPGRRHPRAREPQTLRITKRIRVGFQAFSAAFGARSVWVSLESDGTVARVDPRRNKVVARIRGFTDPNGLVYAYRAVWVSDLAAGRVVRVDPRTNRITARIKIPKADWITPGAGALWVSSEKNRVYRLDPHAREVTATVAVGANPLASAWVGDELWVPNIDSNSISVVDPATNAVSRTISAGNAPLGVLSTPDGVFVSMSNDGAVWRFPTGS